MDYVADMLGMPHVKVYEVASFYTMFNRAPVGKHLVQVCTNISCCLNGSDKIMAAAKEKLGIAEGETTKDNQFTLVEVECLGACVNAPVMQVNDDFYEDLSPESTVRVLDELAKGGQPKPGSQTGRQGSAKKGATA
jgi:NADH-quinone oxidoreductase subunit E